MRCQTPSLAASGSLVCEWIKHPSPPNQRHGHALPTVRRP
jgi:hypothetical protein